MSKWKAEFDAIDGWDIPWAAAIIKATILAALLSAVMVTLA